MSWKPFLRQGDEDHFNGATYSTYFDHIVACHQLFVCSGPWVVCFITGLYLGLPTVLLPQLRRANQTITEEQASWLTATYFFGGIPWVLLLAASATTIGRKKSHVIVCISTLIGSFVCYFSTSITYILVGSIFQAVLQSATFTTSIAIVTEYVSVKYRGVFLTIKSASVYWGILVSNTIGTFFSWNNIPMLGGVCGLYVLVNVIFWPESPLWLAYKGRIDESALAHIWLKGEDVEAKKEFNNLLISKDYRKLNDQKWSFKNMLHIIRQKSFVKCLILACLLTCLHAFFGKIICTIYALEVLKKITNNESAAYSGMLILDGVTVFSMYLGCFIAKVTKTRILLISSSISGIIFLTCVSGYLYLVKLNVLDENKYVTLILLAGYSISVGCVMVISSSILGELSPSSEGRMLSMCAIAILVKIIYGTALKISPLFFKHLAVHGTFALFAALTTVFLILIYKYLPETKNKTLQEIEKTLKGNDKNDIEEGTELINQNLIKSNR